MLSGTNLAPPAVTLGRDWGVTQTKPLATPTRDLTPWLNPESTMEPRSEMDQILWWKSDLRPKTNIQPGDKFGSWVLVKEVMPVYRVDHGKYRYRSRYGLLRCACGTETYFELKYLHKSVMCRTCAQKLRRERELQT